jgi:spore coat polysaccharide biosynthesis protein SpsF
MPLGSDALSGTMSDHRTNGTSAAIVLQARMGSSRLPGKVLADLAGRSILEHCVERLRKTSGLPVVLATTTRADDDCLQQLGERLGIVVVRGSEQDVLGRFALVVSLLGLSVVIRATADNPAVDLDAPRRSLEELVRTGADHLVESGLPYGAAVEAISADALLRAAELATDSYDREHVTPFLRRDSRFVALEVAAPKELCRPALRLSVDTEEDLLFMRRLFAVAEADAERPVPLAHLIETAGRLAGC